MRAPFDGIPVPTNSSAICPQCRSTNLLAVGRVFANRSGVQGLYRCGRCATEAWLPTTDRHHGLSIAARHSDEAPRSAIDLTAGTGVRWHSSLATDRPRYHDDTRCPDGGAIKLEDRRPGDGGRGPCERCAGFPGAE